MTSDAQAGSAMVAKQPDAGSPPATTGSNDQGSSNGAADPLVGLDDPGSREWAEKNGVKSFPDAVKAAREAQSLIGKSIQLPGPEAKPEDWDKVFDKLGRPKEDKEYEFPLPDGLPADMPYNEQLRDSFRPVAHKLGLTKAQAAGLHDWMAQEGASAFKADKEAKTAKVAATTEALEKTWGGPRDSEQWKAKSADMKRTVKAAGIEEELTELGAIGPNGLILAPKTADLLAKASTLFKEDRLEPGNAAATTNNPFAGDADKLNWTSIHQAIRSDPAKARRDIVAAGKQLKDFGLT